MPKIFGIEHLIYLAVFVVLSVIAIILVKKFVKKEKTLTIILKILAVFLLAFIIWNRITICLRNNNWIYLLPNSFCGLSSLLLSISVLVCKKDSNFFHYICYIGFIGALVTLAYPDFIGQANSIFFPGTISSLLHHSLMMFIIVLMTATKYFIPTLSKWKYLPIGLCCAMTYGIFLVTALKMPNAMYIYKPLLSGTIFSWWFTGILVLVFSYLYMFIVDVINKKIVLKKIKQKNKLL